jgi:hypothetical protein
LKIIDKLSTMTRAMRDEYKGGGFRVFLQRKMPPWMKYKNNMQMKAQCQNACKKGSILSRANKTTTFEEHKPQMMKVH